MEYSRKRVLNDSRLSKTTKITRLNKIISDINDQITLLEEYKKRVQAEITRL